VGVSHLSSDWICVSSQQHLDVLLELHRYPFPGSSALAHPVWQRESKISW